MSKGQTPPGIILTVRVTPNAKRDEFAGRMEDGTQKIRLRAPAVEGKANRALIDFLSEKMGVPRSAITILSGETGRLKRIEIRGIK